MLSLVLISVLAAPMPGEAEARRFKSEFEAGEREYQQGEYGAAIAHFREADHIRVTPEVAYDLAKCFERLGDDAFTLYYYRLYLRRAPNSPDTLEIAEKVGTLLAVLESDGQGYLELDAPRASAVSIAGKTFPEPPVAVFLPPGDYEVKAQFPSGPRTLAVQLRTGKTTSLTFEPLAPPMLNVESGNEPAGVVSLKSAAPVPLSPIRVASYTSFGVGALCLLAGLALGAASSDDARAAQDHELTIGAAQARATSANGKAQGANVLFGVSAAAAAAGGALLVVSFLEPAQPPVKAERTP